MSSNTTKWLILLAYLSLVACNDSQPNKQVEKKEDLSYLLAPANNTRQWLTITELNSPQLSQPSAYHNGYFMPIGDTEPAIHALNDTLTISSGELSDLPSRFDDNSSANRFPEISFHMFSHNGYLVPSYRDIIIPDGQQKQWRVILSPGKTWSEPGDEGMSRASFPFALVDRSWNNTLNGIATFAYDDASVTNLRVQIVQQTSAGFLHEGAATLSMSREANTSMDIELLAQQFDNELANLLPTKPWAHLSELYPDINFTPFNDGLAPNSISASAIWHNNKIYMQACHTQYGEFPYCQFMRHGIFSATKSAAAALALSHLAQRYGEEVLAYRVADYIDIEAPHDGWDRVTFVDLINMAAGIGNHDTDPASTNYHADENQSPMGNWSRATSASEKISIATQQYGNFPWQPGEVFRYNTTHTFMLSAAMDSLVRQREGQRLWPWLMAHVYRPIGIAHLPMMHTTESDPNLSLPVFGVGLYPTVDEAIKIANLFHNLGQYQGKQLLHPEVTRNMLYRTSEHGFRNVHDVNQYGEGKYHRSFWGTAFGHSNCSVQVPFMNGYGGNLIGILPNGVIVLRFAEAQNYRTLPMIEVAAQLAPVCS